MGAVNGYWLGQAHFRAKLCTEGLDLTAGASDISVVPAKIP